jgi:signal transduction histidine kinase
MRWMIVWARRDEQGGMFGSMTDVTESRRIQNLKASFVAAVSHELRTPLTSILGFTKTLLRTSGLGEAQKVTFLKIIHEQSNHLTHLIEGILDLSRLDRGVVELQLEEVDPVDLFRLATQEARSLCPGVRIVLYSPNKPFRVTADGNRIRSILDNLLMNAAKFSHPMGTVSVKLRTAGSHWFFEIEDEGVGIDPIDHERVFERFYRVPHPGREIPGTGLGLAIVGECVSLHKGRVILESAVGQGARFRVVLPKFPFPTSTISAQGA